MILKRILVPVDYSEFSRRAVEYAAFVAERTSAKLDVLHVWDRPNYVSETASITHPERGQTSLAELIRENAEREMQEFLDGCQLPPTVHVTHHLVGGEPSRKILECASTGYELIVVGTHGRSGLRHMLLGSVAERLVRMAPVPVLSVPGPPGTPQTD